MSDIFRTIRKIADAGGISDTHDPAMMASIYAGQCETINGRLNECMAYIEKGMISRAVEESLREPPLIPLCQEMAGIEASRWSDLCREKGWQVPPILPRESMDKLKARLEAENAIAPLLSRLRRANNIGDAPGSIVILREMVKADPGNISWQKMLMDFEKYRLGQIPAEIERFKKENSLNELAMVIMELKGKWTAPVDAAILEDAGTFMKDALARDVVKRAGDMLKDMEKAFEKKDFKGLSMIMPAWDRLRKSPGFKLDQEMGSLYEGISLWFHGERARIHDEKAGEEILSQIREKLAHGTDQGLGELLESLKSRGMNLPPGMAREIDDLAARAGKKRRRTALRKRRRTLMVGATAMVSLGLLFLLFHFYSLRVGFMDALDENFHSRNLGAFNSVLDEMEDGYGFLFRGHEIERELKRAGELKKFLDGERESFQSLIVVLETMAMTGFNEPVSTVESLLDEARGKEKALGEEALERLNVVDNLWNLKKTALKAGDELLLVKLLNDLEVTFRKIKGIMPGTSNLNDDETTLFKPIEDILARTDQLHMDLIKPELKNKLARFLEELDQVRSSFEARKEQIEGLLLEDTLEGYLEAIKRFTLDFPQDPVAVELAPVLKRASLYGYLVNSDSRHDPSNPFWGRLFGDMDALGHNIALHAGGVVDDLKKMEQTPRFVDIWECQVKRPNHAPQKWYFSGEPAREFIDGILSYRGLVHALSPEDTQPFFQAGHVITAHVEGLQKMPHCHHVQQMVDHIRYETVPGTIVMEMQRLHGLPDLVVPPILKLHLMEFLLRRLQILTGRENSLEFIPMARDFSSFIAESEVHWLCTAHRKYKIESRRAGQILGKHFGTSDIPGKFLARLKIMEITARRSPRWVGFTDPRDKDILHIKTLPTPSELWVVRGGEDENGSIQVKTFVTEEHRDGSVHKHLDHKGYIPGEPLFAPYDSNTTRDVLLSLLGDAKGIDVGYWSHAQGMGVDFWPVPWPSNVRGIHGP
ncbi:MAG: hypothetical protein HQK66_01075 [Desulfamplus sp.]|nr:hypothetical protein [Desulfamplus sp.]